MIAKFADMSALSIIKTGASDDQDWQLSFSTYRKFVFYCAAGVAWSPGALGMNDVSEGNFRLGNDIVALTEPSCRDLLRAATQAPHQRLHLHAGFSAVKDGTISLPGYRALLICLYGFYLPFERAAGFGDVRTQWLERDLAWLGVGTAELSRIPLCADIPRYGCLERKLGALYVVEGSALGGRMLCRGLDQLLGGSSIQGRRFFAGHGAGTGAAWLGFLARLESANPDPMGRAALVSAAVETFELFERWLRGWDETTW
jgi:heme oxygenase